MAANGDGPSKDPTAYYFIPFGRYEANRSAEYPANEVLVGREKQRAELLKHLFSAGRRGAYLVTGHRGSGKTSFVQHCLREYHDDVYQRFLQRNVGRSFLWDRFGQLALVAVLLAVGVFLSELLGTLIVDPGPRFLAWPVILLLTILLAYPWMAAYRTLRVALEWRYPFRKDGGILHFLESMVARPQPNPYPLVLLVTLILTAALLPPVADPAGGVVHLLFVTAAVLATTHLSSWWTNPNREGAIPCDDPAVFLGGINNTPPWRWWLPRIALIASPLVAISAYLLPDDFIAAPLWQDCLTIGALLLLELSLFSRFVQHRHSAPGHEAPSTSASKSATRWYRVAGVLSGLVAFFFSLHVCLKIDNYTPLVVTTVLGLLFVIPWPARAWFGSDDDELMFNPKPRILLLLKSYALVVVGNQLLFPILSAINVSLSSPLRSLTHEGHASIFQESWGSGGAWLLMVLVLIVILDSTEYEWIVRPFSKMREDYALHRSRRDRHEVMQLTKSLPRLRENFKKAARQTFFWRMYSLWLPVLVVPVNLGFDLLDQRLVIEAMLAGLRNAYRRAFLHWSGTFTALRRGLVLLTLIPITIMIGDQLFAVRSPQAWRSVGNRTVCHDYVDPGYFSPRQDHFPTGLWLACRLGGEPTAQTLLWRPFAGSGGDSELDSWSLERFLHLGLPGRNHPFDLPLYVGLTFLALTFCSTQLSRRWGLPPYRQMDKRMQEVLDGLSQTLREENRSQDSTLLRWLSNLTGGEKVTLREGGPFDPRTVELNFLNVLADIQDPGIQIPFGSGRRISPPIPEIIFVFDELDKVGAGAASAGYSSGPEDDTSEPLDQERQRTRALHSLFADLKNTICSGDARFLFVGGRNLHDEWLADQTARRPLLTYIFDLELYIPSLLTDTEKPTAFKLQGIDAFLRRQKFRADCANRSSRLKRFRPFLTIWVEELDSLAFVQLRFPEETGREDEQATEPPREAGTLEISDGLMESQVGEDPWPKLSVYSSDVDTALQPDLFLQEFREFLAYRSRGNVKRLRELVETFLDPLDSRYKPAPPTDSTVRQLFRKQIDCDHILAFGRQDRFQIMFIADLYRQLAPVLDRRIRLKDDRIPQAILYLADFLLKFHRRAFAWSNVERVDELVHIHRAPDLRHAMQGILTVWEDRFLHRIRNGMYDFRCTSEFAQEIDYLSRSSDQESAALNFTLDESQFLKAIYRSRIKVLGSEEGGDFVAGLAELHKFDEEYELARAYLRQAISALDDRFQREMESVLRNSIRESFGGDPEGLQTLRLRLSWGILRIRMMLQVGMTFERAQNLEGAEIEYREARTLAKSLFAALSGWLDEADLLASDAAQGIATISHEDLLGGRNAGGRTEYLMTLKHLYILFQPLFAEAWAIEKMSTGVDTSPALLESALRALREMLPFVNSQHFPTEPSATSSLDIKHSNFGYLMAELHDKAGDLLFFKGRQLVTLRLSKEWASGDRDHGAEGYLMRAIHHYCVALHDLRRAVVYRRQSSSSKFGMPHSSSAVDGDTATTHEQSWATIVREGWTDFTYRVAAGSLADLSDALLARYSYTRMIGQLVGRDPVGRSSTTYPELKESLRDAYDLVVDWLETPGETLTPETDKGAWARLARSLVSESTTTNRLADWLGLPAKRGDLELIAQSENNEDPERLISALLLSFVSARMLYRSGRYEAAGQQFLQVTRTVTELHWWRLTLHATFPIVLASTDNATWELFADPGEPSEENGAKRTGVLGCAGETRGHLLFQDLFCLAVIALEEAERSFFHARPGDGLMEGQILVDLRIPAKALTTACSLGIVRSISDRRIHDVCRGRHSPGRSCPEAYTTAHLKLFDTVKNWSSQEHPAATNFKYYRSCLRMLLQARGYPLLNYLNGLKVLIDSALLSQGDAEPNALDELVHFYDEYDSPFHFTPFQFGTSVAVLLLNQHQADLTSWLGVLDVSRNELLRLALERLRESQQMYTLQKKYYNSAANLFYLYDDFNDRSIHFNQALQMAGTECASFLLRNLEQMLPFGASGTSPTPPSHQGDPSQRLDAQ